MTETKQEQGAQTIFREEALSYIATPSDVNKIISITGLLTWLLIVPLVLISILGLSWLFYGSIPITLSGQGILIPKKGIFKTVTSPEGLNTIKKLTVTVGQVVKENQIIAVLENVELNKAVTMHKKYIEELKKKRREITTEATKDIRYRKEQYLKKKEILLQKITEQGKYKEYILENMRKHQWLLEHGYDKGQDLLAWESQLHSVIEMEANSKSQLIENEKSLLFDQENWKQKELDIYIKLHEEIRDFNNFKSRQTTVNFIRSTMDGQIISIHCQVGDQVPRNAPIVTLSQGDDKQLEALLYFDAFDGKKVQKGMHVYMIPTHLEKEHVGYIQGEVIEVSLYPENAHSLMSRLQNAELVKKFTQSNPLISARISIPKDHRKTLPLMQSTTPGTLIFGRVITERLSPLAIITPRIKNILEITS